MLTSVTGLPLLAAGAWAAASYPAIPQDKTTPVQQRLAVKGPNCKLVQATIKITFDASR